ncbi:MAG: Holliday junction branch migration protein RuvA [Bacteroidetes bacterium]|nr:Holliday junction branch migration protein RuvA [Bacteroidota bacterium]
MYDYFKGTVVELNPTYVVVECGGIGYSLMISLQTYSLIAESGKKEAQLYAHLYNLPNDLPVLYGFGSKEERQVFRLLTGVSGVGGNTARTILSTFGLVELNQIITSRDSNRLRSVKGLGAKTSEKVIIELVDKMSSVEFTNSEGIVEIDNNIVNEAITALQMLGFNKMASEKVVKKVIKSNPNSSIEQIIKLSLKMI